MSTPYNFPRANPAPPYLVKVIVETSTNFWIPQTVDAQTLEECRARVDALVRKYTERKTPDARRIYCEVIDSAGRMVNPYLWN